MMVKYLLRIHSTAILDLHLPISAILLELSAAFTPEVGGLPRNVLDKPVAGGHPLRILHKNNARSKGCSMLNVISLFMMNPFPSAEGN